MKFKVLLAVLLSLTVISCGNGSSGDGSTETTETSTTKPSLPTGLGYELSVDVPDVSYPLPVVDNVKNNGLNDTKFTDTNNPIVKILYGFMSIWTHGNTEWHNGSVDSSNGLSDFSNEEILDETIWQENIQYVVDVCKYRTAEQALAAYYDDVRG
ncbi:MAG: hypothetical protein PVJ19_15380, partial [Desulfobacteraceae bacterium]